VLGVGGVETTIKTHDAELYIGWPTTPDDLERDASVQVGVRYGVDARWAVLTSPDQVADLRRQLQRASRAVWPDSARIGPPPELTEDDVNEAAGLLAAALNDLSEPA